MRISLRWQFVAAFVLLLVISIGGLTGYLIKFIDQSYLATYESNLVQQARIMAGITTPAIKSGPPYSDLISTVNYYRSKEQPRATVILPDGRVIADSFAAVDQMENHADRLEVLTALRGYEATETRQSSTMGVDVLYAAVPMIDEGKVIAVFRLALPLTQIEQDMDRVIHTIIGASILTTIGMVLVAIFLSGLIVRPLHQLTDTIRKTGRADLDDLHFPDTTARSDEIGHLESAFNQMASELKQQISQLQNERGTLSSILAHMTDGVLMVNSDGKVVMINPAAESMFSIKSSNALDRSLIEVVRQHEAVELWQNCKLKGEQLSIMMGTAPERYFFQVFATPLDLNTLGNTLLVFQDLTKLKRLEMIRRDFVSNVSHELRTPLASLKAITETLTEGALEDPPAARRFLIQMDKEIDNLTQMVRELLELSKIESGIVPLKLQPISPVLLLKPAVERMRIQAERSGISLELDCPDGLPKVQADPDRLEQVLVNLMHNSIKYTSPGGEIHVKACAEPHKIIFTVTDTGVGIAPDDLQRIFERFYKADRARSGGGTGLGLSIARHIIEAHGGRIWAQSTPGVGTTVYFSIPV